MYPQITSGMRRIMVEMWQPDPNARLSTLNVLKSLDGLVSHLPKPEAEFSFGGGSSRTGFGSTYTPSQSFT